MVTSVISAGDAANLGVQTTGGNDGVLVLRSGAAGAKVDALSIAASGTATFVGEVAGVSAINSGQIGGRRNIFYNGEMKVAQRGASATGLGASSGIFVFDRWQTYTGGVATAGRYTLAQVADGPPGFANSLKISTTTADTSIAAGERFNIYQRLEGQDVQQMQKGTATAKQVTVSFYVKGNATALYVCELFDLDNNRSITQSFAVTTSWNRIELTFAADTTGALDDDNAGSFDIEIWLHGGSTYTGGTFAVNTWNNYTNANRYAVSGRTSIFDSTSRTFFLTGVQMEIGATATDFEHRTFGTELALCQRYYEKSYDYDVAVGATTYVGIHAAGGSAASTSGTSFISGNNVVFTVRKRDNPTIVGYDQAGNVGKSQRWELGSHNTNNQNLEIQSAATRGFYFYSSGTSSSTGVQLHFTADAEI